MVSRDFGNSNKNIIVTGAAYSSSDEGTCGDFVFTVTDY